MNENTQNIVIKKEISSKNDEVIIMTIAKYKKKIFAFYIFIGYCSKLKCIFNNIK
jgi:hypothetical protein